MVVLGWLGGRALRNYWLLGLVRDHQVVARPAELVQRDRSCVLGARVYARTVRPECCLAPVWCRTRCVELQPWVSRGGGRPQPQPT